jgi:hypothetical protein
VGSLVPQDRHREACKFQLRWWREDYEVEWSGDHLGDALGHGEQKVARSDDVGRGQEVGDRDGDLALEAKPRERIVDVAAVHPPR